jgi:hypothetical protein
MAKGLAHVVLKPKLWRSCSEQSRGFRAITRWHTDDLNSIDQKLSASVFWLCRACSFVHIRPGMCPQYSLVATLVDEFSASAGVLEEVAVQTSSICGVDCGRCRLADLCTVCRATLLVRGTAAFARATVDCPCAHSENCPTVGRISLQRHWSFLGSLGLYPEADPDQCHRFRDTPPGSLSSVRFRLSVAIMSLSVSPIRHFFRLAHDFFMAGNQRVCNVSLFISLPRVHRDHCHCGRCCQAIPAVRKALWPRCAPGRVLAAGSSSSAGGPDVITLRLSNVSRLAKAKEKGSWGGPGWSAITRARTRRPTSPSNGNSGSSYQPKNRK